MQVRIYGLFEFEFTYIHQGPQIDIFVKYQTPNRQQQVKHIPKFHMLVIIKKQASSLFISI